MEYKERKEGRTDGKLAPKGHKRRAFQVTEQSTSAKIYTAEVLNTVLRSKYNLPTSFLAPHTLDIMKIIHDEVKALQVQVPADQLEATGGTTGRPRGRGPARPRKRSMIESSQSIS